jgi:thiamine-phosphate pyrophosphorylase
MKPSHHPDYTLYMVTDAPPAYRHGFLASVEAAVAGGATIVQYRSGITSRRELYETGAALRDLLKRLRVPLIINDHADLALALDADGVHVGQNDLPAAVVRKLIGKHKLLGLSVSNREQLLAIDAGIVDYIGIGPVFPTQTKSDAAPATGIASLSALVSLAPLPTVAIGGITPGNAASVFAAGVNGIAVVTALSRAPDIRAAAQALRAAASNANNRVILNNKDAKARRIPRGKHGAFS